MPSLAELRSVTVQLEAGLEQLRQRLAEVEDQLAALRAAQRQGRVAGQTIQQQEDLVLELRREIQRRKIAIAEIAEQIAAAEAVEQQDRLRQLGQDNEAIQGELALLRRELLKALLGMAGLLRRHQRLAEQKVRLSRDLAQLTDRDFAYENYISCALLHQQDYTGDIQYVVDTLKKARPVA